ncbi:TonB-dependent receptor, partial [Mycobacterium tuberculosis]|nr:TonB-dependent receptor [Mycobacterium tuberculosis]
TVNLAGRVSDYNNRTGTVSAYNIQGVYAPIPDLRFRVAYATSVRAPTQSDLFASANQNFQSITDPCLSWEDSERLLSELAAATATRL